MIKAIIIEDEAVAARKLVRLIKEVEPEIMLQPTIDSVAGAYHWLSQNPVDLIFLDIHLSDGNSFSLFDQLDLLTPIIFTTAYDEFAIKAFQQNSVDYLLKPITKDALLKSIKKFKSLYQKSPQIPEIDYRRLAKLIQPDKGFKKRFLIRIGAKLKTIETGEIAYFETREKSVDLLTKSNRRFPVDYSLSQLEQILDPSRFFRLNRQYLSSSEAIQEMVYLSTSRLKIQLKPISTKEVYVSVDRIGKFKRWLNQ